MATMISGAALMDGALLLIAANEQAPQPQTREHLAALEITGVDKIIIIQNKIELVTETEAKKNYKQIEDFVAGTIAEKAPIIPMSAMFGTNVDVLIQTIEELIPTPQRDLSEAGLLYIARSFDINKPGTRPEDLKGGVIGGTLIQGKVKVGDEIEICPGVGVRHDKGGVVYTPLVTRVKSIQTGSGKSMKTAQPSGLIGVGTNLDPAMTRADSLIGNLAGISGHLPPVIDEVVLEAHLLKRVVGSVNQVAVGPIKSNEMLMLIVGSTATVGEVSKIGKKGRVHFQLRKPVCTLPGQRVALSRQVEMRWRLIGWGTVVEK